MAAEVGGDESEAKRPLGVAIEVPRLPARAVRRGMPLVPLGMGAGQAGQGHAALVLLAQQQVRVRGDVARPQRQGLVIGADRLLVIALREPCLPRLLCASA